MESKVWISSLKNHLTTRNRNLRIVQLVYQKKFGNQAEIHLEVQIRNQIGTQRNSREFDALKCKNSHLASSDIPRVCVTIERIFQTLTRAVMRNPQCLLCKNGVNRVDFP